MNSPSVAYRPTASEIALTVLALIVVIGISQAARHYLPSPSGRTWLWLPAIVGLAVAWFFSRNKQIPAYRFVLLYGLGGLTVQAIIQALVVFGIARL